MQDIVRLSSEAKKFKAGIYLHFKGEEYQVFGVAIHSETLEEMVVYRSLNGHYLTRVRPLKMFIETVNNEGKKVKRFEFIREMTGW